MRDDFAVVGVSEAFDHFVGMLAARFRDFRFVALAVGGVAGGRVHSCAASEECARRRESCAALLASGADGEAARASEALAQERELYATAAAVVVDQWNELRQCRVQTAALPWGAPPERSRSQRKGRAARMGKRGA